ncbi:hypothetical protein P8C59_007913 [Phyllachora maydis]|uniref:Uncharacterized protein n=1 Tax=Phyllachora maydis TaxID=1825666 RepID=A0AAD9I9N5_9PEZI|nr:hypothetical protein P8C59_007913 [Phyllachora maydis]
MSDVSVLELRLDVAHPYLHVVWLGVEGALEDGAGAGELLLLELELRLFQVGKPLRRPLKRRLLSVNRLAQERLGRDLHRRRRLVLDPWWSA